MAMSACHEAHAFQVPLASRHPILPNVLTATADTTSDIDDRQSSSGLSNMSAGNDFASCMKCETGKVQLTSAVFVPQQDLILSHSCRQQSSSKAAHVLADSLQPVGFFNSVCCRTSKRLAQPFPGCNCCRQVCIKSLMKHSSGPTRAHECSSRVWQNGKPNMERYTAESCTPSCNMQAEHDQDCDLYWPDCLVCCEPGHLIECDRATCRRPFHPTCAGYGDCPDPCRDQT